MEGYELLKKINSLEQLNNIVLGGAFLGSGGGGGIEDGKKMAKFIIDNCQEISVYQPDDIPINLKNKKGAVVCFTGSPKAGQSNPIYHAPYNAVQALQDTMKEKIEFLLPVEIGGVNSLAPLTVASKNNDIAIIDGDGAGRAVPQLENTLYATKGISVYPNGVANDPSGTKYPLVYSSFNITNSSNNVTDSPADVLESLVRSLFDAKEYGEQGGVASYTMTGQKVKDVVIKNTLSLTHELGRLINKSLTDRKSPIKPVLNFLDSLQWKYYSFGPAKVTKISEPVPTGGFDKGRIEIQNGTKKLNLIYENENLFAYYDGDQNNIWAMAPDLICYINDQGPVTNVEIKEGLDITVIGIAVNNAMRINKITDRFMTILSNLQCYKGSYIPIENLPIHKM